MLVLGPQSEEAIELLAPFITSPGVMAVVLIYIALLVPAVEEIFKPIGVWLFARKLDSASQGFALGALSGAGYALIETIGVSGQQASDWAEILFSRIGTGLLHITTSALVGAAIVLALRERRYMRLLGSYLFAVLLHGLWNALAMFFTFSTIADMTGQAGQLSALQPFMIAAMAALAVVLFGILILHNRKWRKTVLPPPAPSAVVDEHRDAGEIV
jgi:RsiW-degrading membrane proteinase PrsW (M82 family)